MPRIALTPAEEALVPRPHSSASQVATAVPSAYTRTATSPSPPPPQGRHPHHKHFHNTIAHHPYYSNSSAAASLTRLAQLASPSATSIPISESYSRSTTPGPRPSSPPILPQLPSGTLSSLSNYYNHQGINSNTGGEQEYPQNPQDTYYSQVPSRPSSPGPPRLAFAFAPRPTRSPSPQLHASLYDHQSWSSHFHRDTQSRPGSPPQQDHQYSWDSSLRVESPVPLSDPDNDSDAGNDSDDEDEGKTARRANSKGFLSKLRKTTSRLSFGDDNRRTRASEESERAPRISHDSASPPGRRKEILQDLSDEEKQQEPRKSRSSWRPSLSLIRQESNGSNLQYYLQNDPNHIHRSPDNSAENQYHISSKNNEGRRRRAKGGKASKKKRRRAKKRRAEQQATLKRQQQLYEQQLAEQAWLLPNLTQVLEKKTRYPLSYDDFEAFLRNQRAVEYLNFWTVRTLCTMHDLCTRVFCHRGLEK